MIEFTISRSIPCEPKAQACATLNTPFQIIFSTCVSGISSRDCKVVSGRWLCVNKGSTHLQLKSFLYEGQPIRRKIA